MLYWRKDTRVQEEEGAKIQENSMILPGCELKRSYSHSRKFIRSFKWVHEFVEKHVISTQKLFPPPSKLIPEKYWTQICRILIWTHLPPPLSNASFSTFFSMFLYHAHSFVGIIPKTSGISIHFRSLVPTQYRNVENTLHLLTRFFLVWYSKPHQRHWHRWRLGDNVKANQARLIFSGFF